jgi:hypothetical protein
MPEPTAIRTKPFVRYFASLILGAGVFLLPVAAAKIGFLGLMVLIALFGGLFYFIYDKTTGTLRFFTEEKADKEIRTVSPILSRLTPPPRRQNG